MQQNVVLFSVILISHGRVPWPYLHCKVPSELWHDFSRHISLTQENWQRYADLVMLWKHFVYGYSEVFKSETLNITPLTKEQVIYLFEWQNKILRDLRLWLIFGVSEYSVSSKVSRNQETQFNVWIWMYKIRNIHVGVEDSIVDNSKISSVQMVNFFPFCDSVANKL